MSATIVRDRRQTTVPADIADRLQIEPGDQIDWQMSGDGAVVRKLVPTASHRSGHLIKDSATGLLYFDVPLSYEEMESAALSANLDRGQ
ncbi:MAG: AbrB/MazE/SpoVT family DNA-binding domain-containing protein [Verrucomicrobiota bacterium]|nr:AbrB/MazE/SpoVT family DNA-binding domain-containing protein [Verrucomicrobiota bacterium]